LFCGGAGHCTNTCPVKSARGRAATTESVKIEGVWYQHKKRLDNPSESAQLVDGNSPCADRVVVLNAIISPKVKALLIPVISLHFPNLSFSCMIHCGSSHCLLILIMQKLIIF
jgi:hypothetical protein